MNALYADAAGNLIDPLDGFADLQARRLRFIENANDRIREDYLRSLRFFRFQAWYGDPDAGLDPDALDAIARNIDGLATLSKERIGSEILKLLSAPNPAPALASMHQTGVLAAVMPGANDGALAPLVYLEETSNTAPDAIRRLAALGGENVPKALRLSRNQSETLRRLKNADAMQNPAALGYKLGKPLADSVLLIFAASMMQAMQSNALFETERGSKQICPVSAADLMPDFEGKLLGDRLRILEQAWISSDFTMTKFDLLAL
jgi:poly(A) polymerase